MTAHLYIRLIYLSAMSGKLYNIGHSWPVCLTLSLQTSEECPLIYLSTIHTAPLPSTSSTLTLSLIICPRLVCQFLRQCSSSPTGSPSSVDRRTRCRAGKAWSLRQSKTPDDQPNIRPLMNSLYNMTGEL